MLDMLFQISVRVRVRVVLFLDRFRSSRFGVGFVLRYILEGYVLVALFVIIFVLVIYAANALTRGGSYGQPTRELQVAPAVSTQVDDDRKL